MKKLIVCLLLQALAYRGVSAISCWVCDNVYSEEECQAKGYLKQCPPSETMCHIELRQGGWGPQPMIQKSCKRPTACADNYVQNRRKAWSIEGEQIQCNENSPSSVCRCCCTTDRCNFNVLSCETIESCPALTAPYGGSMTCDNGFQPLSTCTFSCRREYGLVGEESLTCDRFGNWSSRPPVCKPITCPPPLKRPEFGRMFCTNRIKLRSVCRFSCGEGYRLHGGKRIQCIDDRDNDAYGLWSKQQPECKPLQCAETNVRHGKFDCTNENFVGSRCTLQCNAALGYRSFPTTFKSMTCQRNEEWTASACCGLPCPPYAIMDFVLVLDSSSSVGIENWEKMKTFIKGFLDDFVVRDDSSRFGIVRYNAEVDVDTRILLNDYTDSTDKVLEAFDKIPYDGSGTRTGKALNYTADVMLKVGNREVARDIVLLITDGKSQDEVVISSKRVRDSGALLYVLPILPTVGRLDIDEIRSMVSDEENILKDALVRGFDALDEQFSAKLTSLVCKNPCQNPFHDHE